MPVLLNQLKPVLVTYFVFRCKHTHINNGIFRFSGYSHRDVNHLILKKQMFTVFCWRQN